jgi:protein-S-isoprenylcysteine O-methyltransferase Ste14
MQALLRTLGWMACVVYATVPSFWLVIHCRPEYWRARPRSPYRVLLPLWITMWVVLGFVSAPWRRTTLYSQPWLWIAALGVFALGFSIYSQAVKNFSGKQLGGVPELLSGHTEQRLVTSGIRGRVRHPVYLGHLCEMLGWSIGTGLVVCYGLMAFAMVTGAVMIRLEDKELEQRFGEEFLAYRRRVPALLPRI